MKDGSVTIRSVKLATTILRTLIERWIPLITSLLTKMMAHSLSAKEMHANAKLKFEMFSCSVLAKSRWIFLNPLLQMGAGPVSDIGLAMSN